jgi:hypothetical protein
MHGTLAGVPCIATSCHVMYGKNMPRHPLYINTSSNRLCRDLKVSFTSYYVIPTSPAIADPDSKTQMIKDVNFDNDPGLSWLKQQCLSTDH